MTEEKKERLLTDEPTKEDVEESSQGHYVIGIGGCGNNLIDAILLRKNSKQFEENTPKEYEDQIWVGHAMVNSNLAELANSYYFTEMKSQKPRIAASQYAFHQYGAGYNWKKGNDLLTEYIDSNSSWDAQWGDDLRTSRLERANSIWLLHSAVGGTGAGATPKFASLLQKASEMICEIPVISFPILRNLQDIEKQENINTIVGLSRLSTEVEAIIPISNEQVRRFGEYELLYNKYNEKKVSYSEENSVIVKFLELVGGCLASAQDSGKYFDITDTYMPFKQYYPSDKRTPAPILAPALKKSTREDLSEHLEIAVHSLFVQGKLIDFDPSTAWGVYLLFCGSPDQTKNISNDICYDQLIDLVTEHVGTEIDQSIELFVQTCQIEFSGLTDTWLMAFVVNPQIPEIYQAYNIADKYKTSETSISGGIRENWESIEGLINNLQNKPSN